MTEQTNQIPRMRTIRCAAEELQISVNALRTWIREGLIPVVHTGKKTLINLELVIEFLYNGCQSNGNQDELPKVDNKDQKQIKEDNNDD